MQGSKVTKRPGKREVHTHILKTTVYMCVSEYSVHVCFIVQSHVCGFVVHQPGKENFRKELDKTKKLLEEVRTKISSLTCIIPALPSPLLPPAYCFPPHLPLTSSLSSLSSLFFPPTPIHISSSHPASCQ